MSLEIVTYILHRLNSYLLAVHEPLMSSYGGIARAIVVLYVMIMGIGYLRASFGEHSNEILSSIVLVIILQSFIMETQVYIEWIVEPILKTVLALASFFINAGGTTSFEGVFVKLDESFILMKNTLEVIAPDTWNPIVEFGYFIKSFCALGVMTIAFGAVYITYMVVVVMGFFSMYVLFIVGGPCLFFAAFKKTRFLAWSWLRAIANYALLIIFSSIVMAICVNGIEEAVKHLAKYGDPSFGYMTREVGYVVCWSFITIGILLKSPEYAAAITGGMAGSTSMATAGLGLTGGVLVSTIKFTGENRFSQRLLNNRASNIKKDLSLGGGRPYSASKGIYR